MMRRVLDLGAPLGSLVAGARIDTDMGLHPEVPLVALQRLAHLRITGTGCRLA
jgi:hypothetical protein